jgi:MFS family permease
VNTDLREYTRAERVHTVVAACLGWLFSAMDIILLLLLREDIEEDLGVSSASLDTAIAMGLVFSALGAVLFAQLGDRYGRARALTLAVLIYSLGTGAMALSWDAWSLVAFRALSGIGTGGEWSLGFALISEVWKPKRRGAVGGLVQSMFNVGTLVGIFLALGFDDHWRLVFGLATVPALAVMYIRLKVPESLLWRRLQEAHQRGEVPEEIRRAFSRPPLGEIFRGKLLKVTLLAAGLFTLMNMAFYMYGSQVTPFLTSPVEEGGLGWSLTQAGPVFFAMTFVAGISAALAGYLSDLVGRRTVYSALCLLGACAFASYYFILPDLDPAQPAAFWVAVVAVSAGYGINGVVGAYFSELYPTHLRATGPGFVSNLGKLLGSGAPLIGGYLAHHAVAGDPRMSWTIALSAPCICYLAIALLIWTLPKVEGRTMAAVECDEYLPK